MIRSVLERRLQNSETRICDGKLDEAAMLQRKSGNCKSNGQITPFSGGEVAECAVNGNGNGGGVDGEDDLYFEMEFPVINRSRCDGSGTPVETASYHSDSYGSQSTLDSRDSPYRDDSSAGRESSQGPRDRPNSLRIPGQSLSDFHQRNNSFCSLPREKVRKIPRISLQNFSVPATPADTWIKDYLDDGDGSNYSCYMDYSPQSLSSSRSKSRLSLNIGADSRSTSPSSSKPSRSFSRILRSSFSRLWGGGGGSGGGGGKDKARTPEPVSELEPFSLPGGPGSTRSSPRPEYGKSWAGASRRISSRIHSPATPNTECGSLRCESPVTPITEEIVQQSIAKGLPIIPFACSSNTVLEERRNQQRNKQHYNNQPKNNWNEEQIASYNVNGRPLRSPQDKLPDLPPGLPDHHQHYHHHQREMVSDSYQQHSHTRQQTQFLEANQLPGRLTISAPSSRKTSRKEDGLLHYIYHHESDTNTVPEETCESEILDLPNDENEINIVEDEESSNQESNLPQEDRSLNSLLLRAKLELEQEMDRRKEAQGRRLRGYAANNSRALERRRSSDNMYVMMSPHDDDATLDATPPPDSAQEATEDYDSDDVFQEKDIINNSFKDEQVQHLCTNSPALSGSPEDSCGRHYLLGGINITSIVASSPPLYNSMNNNNDKNFPNSNIEIRIESEDDINNAKIALKHPSQAMSVPTFTKRSTVPTSPSTNSCCAGTASWAGTSDCCSTPQESNYSQGLTLSNSCCTSRTSQCNSLASHCTSPSSQCTSTASQTVSPASSLRSFGTATCSRKSSENAADYLPMDMGTKFSKKK